MGVWSSLHWEFLWWGGVSYPLGTRSCLLWVGVSYFTKYGQRYWTNVYLSVPLPSERPPYSRKCSQLWQTLLASWPLCLPQLLRPPWIKAIPITGLRRGQCWHPVLMITRVTFRLQNFFHIATQAPTEDWSLSFTVTISQVLFLHWFHPSGSISSESKQTSSFNLIQS
jgi:hypothetical protein